MYQAFAIRSIGSCHSRIVDKLILFTFRFKCFYPTVPNTRWFPWTPSCFGINSGAIAPSTGVLWIPEGSIFTRRCDIPPLGLRKRSVIGVTRNWHDFFDDTIWLFKEQFVASGMVHEIGFEISWTTWRIDSTGLPITSPFDSPEKEENALFAWTTQNGGVERVTSLGEKQTEKHEIWFQKIRGKHFQMRTYCATEVKPRASLSWIPFWTGNFDGGTTRRPRSGSLTTSQILLVGVVGSCSWVRDGI